jgi:hypothetical protein
MEGKMSEKETTLAERIDKVFQDKKLKLEQTKETTLLVNVKIELVGAEPITLANVTEQQAGHIIQWVRGYTGHILEMQLEEALLLLNRNQLSAVHITKIS